MYYKIYPLIAAEEQFAATLQYLASGDSKQSKKFQYKMGKSTINGIIDEACYAFWDSVAVFVNIPRTAYDWMRKYL